jgi:hypothetical protein
VIKLNSVNMINHKLLLNYLLLKYYVCRISVKTSYNFSSFKPSTTQLQRNYSTESSHNIQYCIVTTEIHPNRYDEYSITELYHIITIFGKLNVNCIRFCCISNYNTGVACLKSNHSAKFARNM